LLSELSGGQQQRIGVVRAIATDADVILMDEPFSALDPITRTTLQEELFNLQEELKKTIIFVTHDMDEALKIADKICIMENGSIAQFDTPENILRKPANDFVKDFVGEHRLWDNPEYIKAKDIMIKNPISVKGNRRVTQGIEIMRTSKVDSLLIVDKEYHLAGIVTVKDIKATFDKSTTLQDIMSKDPLYVNESDTLVEVLEVMNKNSVGYMPVISSKWTLVGLITRSSLLSVLSEQFLEMEVSILG
jgi:osmoprotectant transport system ATP-binding protein